MEQGTLDQVRGLPYERIDHDMTYVPLPNRSELVFTPILPPLSVAPTAFLVPVLENGCVVVAVIRKSGRGVEIPGDHVEPGETLMEAAVREAFEETGCTVDMVRPIGFQRLISDGIPPEGYRYPFPLSFQVFFAGRVTSMRPPPAVDEVIKPRILDPVYAHLLLPPAATAIAIRASATVLETLPHGPAFG